MQPLNELLNESYLVKELNIKETDVNFSENLQNLNESLAYILNKLKETISYENYKLKYEDVEDDYKDIIIKSLMLNKKTLRNLVDKILHKHQTAPEGSFYKFQSSIDYALISHIFGNYRYRYRCADIVMELIDNTPILVKDGSVSERVEVFFDKQGNVCYKIDVFSWFQSCLGKDYNLFNERRNNMTKERGRQFENYGTFLKKRQETLIEALSDIIGMGLPFAYKSTYTKMLDENPELNSVLNPCYEFDMEVEVQ